MLRAVHTSMGSSQRRESSTLGRGIMFDGSFLRLLRSHVTTDGVLARSGRASAVTLVRVLLIYRCFWWLNISCSHTHSLMSSINVRLLNFAGFSGMAFAFFTVHRTRFRLFSWLARVTTFACHWSRRVDGMSLDRARRLLLGHILCNNLPWSLNRVVHCL